MSKEKERESAENMYLLWVSSTRRHIPEDDTLHNHRCENLKCIYYTKDKRGAVSLISDSMKT
jgi:hypothetical protein